MTTSIEERVVEVLVFRNNEWTNKTKVDEEGPPFFNSRTGMEYKSLDDAALPLGMVFSFFFFSLFIALIINKVGNG